MKIHLATYGTGRFSAQRERFRQEAEDSGFFDEVRAFSPKDFDEEFTEKCGLILGYGRGGGYWIWKPYVIKKAMDALHDGDVLVYCDAGCTLNVSGERRYREYLALLQQSDSGVLAFELAFKAYKYTKQEIFDYFRAPEPIINANLICAGINLYRKCEHSVNIIDSWLQVAYDNPWLFTDALMPIPRHPEFVENRHDQSIYSILINTYGAEKIPDETYFMNWEAEGAQYPFWATRKW